MNDYYKAFRQFMGKYGNTIFWLVIAYFALDGLYTIYQNPAETWETVKRNVVNPWYYIPIGLITIFWVLGVVAVLVDKYYLTPLLKRQKAFLEGWKESIEKTQEENEKLHSGEIPSDEDIKKYYKMYLKKFELDNKDQWTTEEPMSFEKFERDAKEEEDRESESVIKKRVGWNFLIAMTSDMFSFSPASGQATMMRFRDYEALVEEDEKFADSETINKQLDII